MASALSIQPGFIRQNDGTVAAAIRSILIKRFLAGNTDTITIGELAKMTASSVEDAIHACTEMQGKGRLTCVNNKELTAQSTMQPADIDIKIFISNGLFDAEAEKQPPKNPLGLFLGHDYKRVDGKGMMTFKGYNGDDDVYSFYSPDKELGMLRGDSGWVHNTFDLLNVPDWDPTMPRQEHSGIDMPELDAEGLKIFRVGAERFAELAALDASATLAKKPPTVKEIVVISDVDYVVVGSVAESLGTDGAIIEPGKLYLQPCRSAGKGEKGNVFKSGKNKYILGEPSERIVVMVAPIEEVIADAPPVPADPLEWMLAQIHNGFISRDGEGCARVYLQPRSFDAARTQLSPDSDEAIASFFYQPQNLEVIKDSSREGFEIDGLEEEPPLTAEEQAALVAHDEWIKALHARADELKALAGDCEEITLPNDEFDAFDAMFTPPGAPEGMRKPSDSIGLAWLGLVVLRQDPHEEGKINLIEIEALEPGVQAALDRREEILGSIAGETETQSQESSDNEAE